MSVGSLTETEQHMISLERINEYEQLPSEFDDSSSDGRGRERSTSKEEDRVFNSLSAAESMQNSLESPLLKDNETDFREFDLHSNSNGSYISYYVCCCCTSQLERSKYALLKESPNDYQTPSSWPSTGSISFSNVSMRYRSSLPLALCNFTLSVPSGARIAIVGRTGSYISYLICP